MHVTTTLIAAFAGMCLVTAITMFLQSPAPVGRTASTTAVITGGEISRSLGAENLASMKSTVMGYDAAHEVVTPPPPPKRVVTITTVTPATTPPPAVQPAVQQPAPVVHAAGIYSYSALEQIWEANGGSPARAATAACIAEHESGGNPNAESPTDDFGLWQIHADPAALNPGVSAHTAVVMSDDGTNWGPWTTAPDCGV